MEQTQASSKPRRRRGGRKNKTDGVSVETPAPVAPVKRASDGDESNTTPHKKSRGGRRGKAKESDKEVEKQESTQTMDHLSDMLFSSLEIGESFKQAIVDELQYERLTHVQKETFPFILEGKDVLAKAKTGNGKTIAFLLPVFERLTRLNLTNTKDTIPALVISPTRELALQIATEAKRLASIEKLRILCVVGGTNVSKDQREIAASKPLDVLIATPGRLQDHLKQDSGDILSKLSKTSVIILDEADRLLDMGFRPDLLRILKHLPKERQTLLFSATLPASTDELRQVALKEDYAFVDTIDENEEDTNVQTQQEYIVCPLTELVPSIESVLQEHMDSTKNYKVMVFFPTARAAQFMAQLFSASKFANILEIHSRKSQANRTKTAETFRKSTDVCMFSSDVSARGVDYPDVTLVVQVGLTDRDQYIHRLGRTARAGMAGKGVLILADFESVLLKELNDLPLEKRSPPPVTQEMKTMKTINHLDKEKELQKSAQQSYQAWLGFYNSNLKRLQLTKEKLVDLAQMYSEHIGLTEVPKLEKKTLKKMNLFGVRGLEASAYEPREGRGGNGGGRGGNGGRGGGRGGRGGRGRGRGF